MRTLEEISADIVNARLRLEGIGMTNIANRKVEDLIELEVARTGTEIRLASLERERKSYMALVVEQAAAFRRP